MTAIRLENVSFRYPGATAEALYQVNLEILEGSFFALLGPNGAGKTTLLRLLCGRLGNYSGRIHIAESFRGGEGFLDSRAYGILLENPGVYPKLSIEEYVRYFAEFYGVERGDFRNRLDVLSESLDLPALSTKLAALSLGNRQKVQLLRAMIHNPKLLILDEPVANLDPISRESVWRMIADWRRQDGGTAIVCSHILAEMEQEATDFAIVDKGKVLKSGSVSSAVSCNFQEGKNFNLTFGQDVSQEQILSALSAAGISNVSINKARSTLSDLYRKTV